ncbi:MAG: ABC transporter ATP-binding protein [Candidatus Peribacteria bacterium]|nr:MAG: ABC transporter ATP-binding protein [Candidatus Peribacteria bacterium]
MKQLERSFWEITKRFFEPAKYLPWLYIKAFIFYGSWAVKGIIHVLFLKEIIGALELGNELLFFQIVGWYIAYILLQEFLDYAMKFWGWLGFSEILQKKIDEIYVPQFIELDNSELEKLGTGKVVSIIKTGSRMWITLTNDIFNQGSQVIVTVLFTTVMIGSIEIEYAFWFFAIYILVHIL